MIVPHSCIHSVTNAVLKASPAAVVGNWLLPAMTTTTTTTTTTAAAVAATSASSSLPIQLLSMSPQLLSSLFLLSGGGGGANTAATVMDVNRFKLRLDGLHAYAVISTLLMNASLRLFSATPKRFEAGQKSRNTIKMMFSIMVTISILTGSYTTIVFSLLELFSKRALGRHMDAATLDFFGQTQPVRESAYDTWVMSIISFQASFVLSLFLNHDEDFGWKIALFGGVAAILCWWKWSSVMTLAAALLQLGSDM